MTTAATAPRSGARRAGRKPTAVRLGYALSSEEHGPLDLVRHARLAEERGFEFAMISDHFHPWIERQGQSPFVWSVIGGIAASTERITIGTSVTAPIMRIHPAILAQAAATSAAMLPGRFWFGVGTGERLNEHILGDQWPEYEQRAEMLEEAIDLTRELWRGELTSFHGDYFDVVNARLYTLPEAPPPILLAAGGKRSAALAGRIGDGLISTAPEAELVEAFRAGGDRGSANTVARAAAPRSRARDDRPRVGQIAVCWAKDVAAARRTAHEWWPTAAIEGDSGQELALPSSFESLAALVDEDSVAKRVICGPDPKPYLAAIRRFVDAGYDHVYLHQIGPDQEGFLRFAERELLPVTAPQ